MTLKRTFRLALPVLALFLVAFASKRPVSTVRFYAEANSQDTNNFMIPVQLHYPPRQAFVEKAPVISERDIAAISPSTAADGTMRCVFKLDTGGAAKLDSISVERRGTSLVAVVNGRQVTDLLIDQRVSDGIIMIPNGLTARDIKLLSKTFPVMKSGFGGVKDFEEEEKAPATSTPHFGD